MSSAVIILIVVSILGSGMAMYVFWPPVFDLAYEQRFWNQTDVPIDTDVLIARDSLYGAMFAVPFMVIGVLAIYAILTMNRRDDL